MFTSSLLRLCRIALTGCMMSELPGQDRFDDQQDQHGVEQAAGAARRGGRPTRRCRSALSSWSSRRSSSRGRRRPAPARSSLAGSLSAGSGLAAKSRLERQRRADLHLVGAGELGLLEVELADAPGGLELRRAAAGRRAGRPRPAPRRRRRGAPGRAAGRPGRSARRAGPTAAWRIDLLHDRRVARVERPGGPAGVGRGRHLDHRPPVPRRLDRRRGRRCRTPGRPAPASPRGA